MFEILFSWSVAILPQKKTTLLFSTPKIHVTLGLAKSKEPMIFACSQPDRDVKNAKQKRKKK